MPVDVRRTTTQIFDWVKSHPKTSILSSLLAPLLLVLVINLWVIASTSGRIFTDLNRVPENDVGLVLGTSKFAGNGLANLHFKARTEAAARLYNAGKVKHLLLSGDNHVKGYDEPADMKEALLKLGVPESAITLDYAGFRTLDSMVRAREIFGLQKVTVITDDFHVNRAVFLGKCYGIDAIAYPSEQVPFDIAFSTRVREVGARVKAALDVYLLNTKPHFLGERIEIRIQQPVTNPSASQQTPGV